MLYLFVKALHIIAVISWMAAMLYLPRLFVYHADSEIGSDKSETFKIMERRLARFIMTPAMIATWIFGITMISLNPSVMSSGGWLHAKLLLVLLMTGLHGVFSKWRKNFAADKNTRSAKFYKIWNEAPTLLLIVIIILAVMKPF